MPGCSSPSSTRSIARSEAGGGFDVDLVDDRPGLIVFRATGRGAAALFAGESGGHRWQRVPPNEKRGRVHSSTVTVAVLPEVAESALEIPARDLEWTACRASGAGGQHIQKTDSAVQVTHLPSGLQVRCQSERSQHQNRATAMAALRARLGALAREAADAARATERRSQIGSGMRGDKRRTVRCQDGTVLDHLTQRTWRLRDYLRGEW
jgi:peptide chain release factor 1